MRDGGAKSSRGEEVIRKPRETDRGGGGERREKETRRHNARRKKVDGTFSAARRRFVSAHNRKIMRPFFVAAEEKLKLMRVACESETCMCRFFADDRGRVSRG